MENPENFHPCIWATQKLPCVGGVGHSQKCTLA